MSAGSVPPPVRLSNQRFVAAADGGRASPTQLAADPYQFVAVPLGPPSQMNVWAEAAAGKTISNASTTGNERSQVIGVSGHSAKREEGTELHTIEYSLLADVKN
jgi:hypothetical protein